MLYYGSPGVLDLQQRGLPTWTTQKKKTPLFLNHNHGEVDKRPIVSSLTHHALAALVVFKAVMSQPLFDLVLCSTMWLSGITFCSLEL